MTGNVKHFAKMLFRTTGLDIVKVGTIESLLEKLAVQESRHRARIDDQHAYLEAYKKEASLVPFRPAQYRYVRDNRQGEILVFSIETNDDFDWLEQAILRHGYYEKPNIWSLTVDPDKRFLAEMIQSLEPETFLDVGCANGALLQALDDLGISGEGVEISSFALERAFPAIRKRIHNGDLLSLSLQENSYDVIAGLDIFEHLNPNRLEAYIARIRDLLRTGGYVFANIPAFGEDEVFGEVFEYYLADWEKDRRGRSCFTTLHVDMHGYPMNGHLIWADTAWWVDAFAQHGFRRDLEREQELHRRYDDKLFYARRSFYLFRKTV